MRHGNSRLHHPAQKIRFIPILPMRHGNGKMSIGKTQRKSIPILPMRHGNYIFRTNHTKIAPNSDPTYEAWKPLWTLYATPRWHLFRSYLWGMETRHHRPSNHARFHIPILPTRHGNLNVTLFFTNGIRFHSDPTYEAWKLFRHITVPVGHSYSDPTYEAWKQPNFRYKIFILLNIPILPTRHGNTSP